MAKPNLTEVYEALRVAEAEGRTEDVAKLISYIESVQAAPDVTTEETYDPREIISGAVPAGAGAAAGVVLPKVIESGVNQVKAGRAAATKPSVTVQGAPLSALADIEEATTKGLSNEVTQQTRTAQRAARTEQMEKILAELKAKGIAVNPKILADMETQYARPGSGILIPVERAKEIAAQEAAAAKAAPKGSLVQRAINQFVNPTISSDIGNFAKGVYDYKLPFIGSVGSLAGRGLVGAGAGLQAADMLNRDTMGDTTGATISGLGALGTAATLFPHPAAKLIGGGIGLSAEAINAYRDAMRRGQVEYGAPENYENTDPMGGRYAQGGLVHLAEGGQLTPEEYLRQMRELLEKGKPTPPPARTYEERLRDMGRDPSIPGSPIVKKPPFTKGGSGAGFVSGGSNPFNPYSPLNRATGGDVKKPDANEGAAFIGYPQINKNRKIGSGTGFLDALVGAPPSRENILNPSDYSYMEGYEKGEPYGIAAMVAPFAGILKPFSKAAKASKYHPLVEKGLAEGRIHPNDAQWMSDYAHTPGQALVETGTGSFKDQSEKMQNFVQRMQKGEVPIPKHWQGEGGISVGGGQFDSGGVKRTENIGYAGGGRVGALTDLMNLIRNRGGSAAVSRLERAADLVPNLEHQYKPDALKSAFTGDNATAVMVMNPKDFEKYAAPIDADYKKSVMKTYGIGNAENFEGYDAMPKGTYQDYINYLGQYAKPGGGGLNSVPYLQLGQELNSSFPSILGHEGRHRTAALEKLGDQSTLIQMHPRAALREPFPRRSQEEYLNALIEQIGQKPFVKPQKYMDDQGKDVRRGLIELPELFKKGGDV